MTHKRPRLGVWKFASCDGCQLSLLDCEDELLAVADAIDIAFFAEAVRKDDHGQYDIAFVEGSITTAHDLERIKDVRARCDVLVTLGACATSGGVQALRNFADVKDFTSIVYARPDYIDTLETSTPIADHVQVDFELRGCPISKVQLIELITALLAGRKPHTPGHSVCIECKLKGNICVMAGRGVACLGPVTHAGCGALCPSFNRGCFGCFGPMEQTNTASLNTQLSGLGMSARDQERIYRTFNVNAPDFRDATDG